MRQVRTSGLAARAERARAVDESAGAALLRVGSSALHAPASMEPPSSLARLSALISTHRALLCKIRDRNSSLEVDNARMERELAGRSQVDAGPGDISQRTRDAPSIITGEAGSLASIRSYLRDTLAQTLWALDARAAKLEEQVSIEERPQAHRVRELTRSAYDQIRSLMGQLHGDSNE